MQGTVDYFGCFIDINVGWPGRALDTCIWTGSDLFASLRSSTFFESGSTDTIHGQEFTDLYLLGDAAYPSSPYLAKGFTGSGLSEKQEYFNWKLAGARMAVERAFRRLKGRWKILQKPIGLTTLNPTLEYIGACCILHNLCEKQGAHYKRAWNENAGRQTQEEMADEVSNAGFDPPQGSDDEEEPGESQPLGSSSMTRVRDALFGATSLPGDWRGRNH